MLEATINNKDFLIVGSGLAACTLAHTFDKYGLSFQLLSKPDLSNCSKIAAGLWNPIVFKRLTKSWLAEDLINFLIPFYKEIEQKTNSTFLYERPLIKNFFEEQEINFWKKKANSELSNFLKLPILDSNNLNFEGSILTEKVGLINHAGNINTQKYINATLDYFISNYNLTRFNHAELSINDNYVEYNGLIFKCVIFCEGHFIADNPYFNFVKLKPAKGEVLKVKSEKLNIGNAILNKDGFIFNNQESEFTVGSTYEWHIIDEMPTVEAGKELEKKLTKLINVPYYIQQHAAGIRPSSEDRRPIIGRHPKYTNLYVFNGLGTKGVMLAPYFANKFVNFYLKKSILPDEVNVARFYSKYHA